jgi:hypothetical protein
VSAAIMIPSLNLIASTLVPVTIGCLDTLSTHLPHRSRRRTACAARPRRRRRAARAARAAGTSRTRRTPQRAALARVGVSAAGGGRAHRAAPVRREVVHRGGRRAGAQGDAQAASVAARPVTCAVSSCVAPRAERCTSAYLHPFGTLFVSLNIALRVAALRPLGMAAPSAHALG